ncbi:hypothetical protein D3Z58_25120, partial [Clostridiaceae bacterium]|nr:hypothetical protein [Clostridiaceae bacterium]
KVVAVTSAAALLAIGASMTSFAATGWVQENGEWFWYDRDGSRVEDEWKKSGNDWYWLDSEENGAMALDKLIEDDGDTYYVNSTGVMVRNAWVSIVNEDQDDDEDPAEYNWYYFQSNGKAYKKGDSGSTRFRTINGKRYAFDDDGKMLYGWVNKNGERESDDEGWTDLDTAYYLGDWNDGSMKTGWQKITVYDEAKEDDMDYWFNFKSNGEKRTDTKSWKSNGKTYAFDIRGVMVYQWTTIDTIDKDIASGSNIDKASTSTWRYFNSPEDGARVTKGWFKVVAPDDDNDNTFMDYGTGFAKDDAGDETERWYYADANGELYKGEIKSIKGKYYGFWPDDSKKGGAMLNGLCVLQMDGSEIEKVIADDIDSNDLDDILDGKFANDNWDQEDDGNSGIYLYYFGNDLDGDGSMKTGNVTVNLDGNSYNFLFKKTGNPAGGRGRGVTGIDDNKYIYNYGCRIKASSDDKYQLVEVVNIDENGKQTYSNIDINSKNVVVKKKDAPKWSSYDFKNDDEETVRYHYEAESAGDDINFHRNGNDNGYYLVNTSGNIQKNKNGVKDGNDCYYYVNKDQNVILYTDNKTLKSAAYKVSSNDGDKFVENFASKGLNENGNLGGNGNNETTTTETTEAETK